MYGTTVADGATGKRHEHLARATGSSTLICHILYFSGRVSFFFVVVSGFPRRIHIHFSKGLNLKGRNGRMLNPLTVWLIANIKFYYLLLIRDACPKTTRQTANGFIRGGTAAKRSELRVVPWENRRVGLGAFKSRAVRLIKRQVKTGRSER